jgi:hypothetical protein
VCARALDKSHAIADVFRELRTSRVFTSKAPGFGDRRKAMLQDVAILTGGQEIGAQDLTIERLAGRNLNWLRSAQTPKKTDLLRPHTLYDANFVRKAVAGARRTQAELHGLSERVRLLRSFPTHT